MTSPAPTLDELRARVFKHSAPAGLTPPGPEIGNWLARRVGRPLAVYGTWLAVRLGLSAHQVTSLAVLATVLGSLLLASGTRAGFVLGVLGFGIAYWLDHVDGQVARWHGTASLDGVCFDYLMHHLSALLTGFALGHGLAVRDQRPEWSLAGLLVGGGWLFLGLPNDCRYKAFFQRLKREPGRFRVQGGAGGRPSPPEPWPRRGRAMLSWPAYKLCEPHVVLPTLMVLAILAVVAPEVWEHAWRCDVVAMALLAPVLATARIARLIGRRATSQEFDRWFVPDA